MPLLPGPRALIEMPVADRQLANTIIRQKARFVRLTHEQMASGESLVTITVQVNLFAAQAAGPGAPDGYGPALTGRGFSPYTLELHADNQTVVDAATGGILAVRQGEGEADWQAQLLAYEQPVMLQGDFFEYLRDHAPVEIGAMIRQYITQADALGRFA